MTQEQFDNIELPAIVKYDFGSEEIYVSEKDSNGLICVEERHWFNFRYLTIIEQSNTQREIMLEIESVL